MDIPTTDLMDAVAKIKIDEQEPEDVLATLRPEELERLSVIVVDADGTLQAIEPIDYSRWR
ncbi:MAG: hypothetical protein GTO14_07265 [Anaerolineales bacterium]|nr:hypothetical protein [Anaerolineales bacterium]